MGRFVLWLVLGLVPTSALAAPEHEALALEAEAIAREHCTDVAGDNVTAAAGAIVQVGQVWERLSASVDARAPRYLLYWRGVLGLCLNQTDKAVGDLESFVQAAGDRAAYAALVDDAERRLLMVGGGPRRAEPAPVVLAVTGGGLLGASGVFFGLTGEAAERLAAAEAAFEGPGMTGAGRDEEASAGMVAAEEANVRLGLAVGAAVLGATSTAIAAALAGRSKRVVGVGILGAPDGAVVLVAGRW